MDLSWQTLPCGRDTLIINTSWWFINWYCRCLYYAYFSCFSHKALLVLETLLKVRSFRYWFFTFTNSKVSGLWAPVVCLILSVLIFLLFLYKINLLYFADAFIQLNFIWLLDRWSLCSLRWTTGRKKVFSSFYSLWGHPWNIEAIATVIWVHIFRFNLSFIGFHGVKIRSVLVSMVWLYLQCLFDISFFWWCHARIGSLNCIASWSLHLF